MIIGARCTWCGVSRRWMLLETAASRLAVPIDAANQVREFAYACPSSPVGTCEAPATALEAKAS